MILPLRLHFRLRLAERSSYFIRVEAVGFPLPGLRRAKRKNTAVQENIQKKSHSLSEVNLQWLRSLLEKRMFRRIRQLGKLSMLHLSLHIALEDAATTALFFSFVRTLTDTLRKTCALPPAFTAHMDADFRHADTWLCLEGIISVRLGRLIGTFLALGAAYLRRIRKKAHQAAGNLTAQ